MDISPLGPSRLPMLAFYRLLALRPGNARSLIALCTRDVLFTRSTVGELATDLPYRVSAPDFHVAGFDRACRKAKTRGIFFFTRLRAV